jgi:hypothetical protein
MNEHREYNTTHSIGKLTVMKILNETNFADNYAFLIIKNCTKTVLLKTCVVLLRTIFDLDNLPINQC